MAQQIILYPIYNNYIDLSIKEITHQNFILRLYLSPYNYIFYHKD